MAIVGIRSLGPQAFHPNGENHIERVAVARVRLINIAMELSLLLGLFWHKENTGTKRQINPLTSQKTITPPPGANHNPKKDERFVDN
jgi:hypothetical protein